MTIVVKEPGKKQLAPPKNLSVPFWEMNSYKKKGVINLKKDRLNLLSVKPWIGFQELLTDCVEGTVTQ